MELMLEESFKINKRLAYQSPNFIIFEDPKDFEFFEKIFNDHKTLYYRRNFFNLNSSFHMINALIEAVKALILFNNNEEEIAYDHIRKSFISACFLDLIQSLKNFDMQLFVKKNYDNWKLDIKPAKSRLSMEEAVIFGLALSFIYRLDNFKKMKEIQPDDKILFKIQHLLQVIYLEKIDYKTIVERILDLKVFLFHLLNEYEELPKLF